MVSRGQQGSGSLTWLLVGAVSLVLVARVQPYPGYVERLPSLRRYPQTQQQQGPAESEPFAGTNDDYVEDDDDELGYSKKYAYDTLMAGREPDIFPYDQAEASNKNLQQILRSFRPVVGGTYPSDRVLPWDDLHELGLKGGRSAEDQLTAPDTSLTQLSFAKHRQKRVMCHFKICNMGRRRRARHSNPLQGWLS
ncbi:uncharacterized protein LOC123517025 isoform X1 [Portunus trituberculatus]|uniref:uncharacterized protein LOC123517025 isoform X1 n=1 Tax=Portunus trituberculatus TaxID=210409 RepID=UPI001E1CE0BA|nr:uncharacterized protein LOC123517025 isoform X1 [Portunus trituberculatus]